LKELQIPVEEAQGVAKKLAEQRYFMKQDLLEDPPTDVQLEGWKIPGRFLNRILRGLSLGGKK